jgi:hypothetical protein
VPLRRLVLAVVVLLLAAAPAARATVVVGIGDQKPSSFADARLRDLGLRSARLIVPWDAATSEPGAVDQWLAAVAAAGMAPHVAFEHLRTDDCPGRPCVVPTQAQYGAAVRRFVARFPQVRTYTTWNEANHASQPVAGRPEAVAGYYDALVAACPSCTVVAGDVLDSGSYANWLRRFLAASSTTPRLWGLHDYGDVTYGRTTGVDTVLALVDGALWVEETGGIVTLRNSAGRTTFATSEAGAATAIDRAFAIAAARPRVTRMSIYEWSAFAGDPFDAGLVRPDGTARPSLAALRRDLAALKPATAAQAPVSWRATWSAARARQVVLRATCPTTVVRCAGRVSATLRTRLGSAARATFARVASRRAYATTSAKRTVVVRIALSAKAYRRARRAPTRRLVLAVAAARPSAATSKVTVSLARPR